MSAKISDKLEIIWAETTNGAGHSRRYIAKAYGNGPSWGIWDKHKNNYVEDRKIASMTVEQLREELQ